MKVRLRASALSRSLILLAAAGRAPEAKVECYESITTTIRQPPLAARGR